MSFFCQGGTSLIRNSRYPPPKALPGEPVSCGFGSASCIQCAGDHALARDIYVNNVMGDDRYNGSVAVVSGDRMGPYRTLTGACGDCKRGSGDCREHHGALSRVRHAPGGSSEWLSRCAV